MRSGGPSGAGGDGRGYAGSVTSTRGILQEGLERECDEVSLVL